MLILSAYTHCYYFSSHSHSHLLHFHLLTGCKPPTYSSSSEEVTKSVFSNFFQPTLSSLSSPSLSKEPSPKMSSITHFSSHFHPCLLLNLCHHLLFPVHHHLRPHLLFHLHLRLPQKNCHQKCPPSVQSFWLWTPPWKPR